MTEASRLKATVYIGGLDHAVTEKALTDAFIPFGEIVNITIPKPDLPSSLEPHRGFGYVEFEASSDAKEAIDNMDQSELFGRIIKVAAAKPQKESNEGLGSRIAVWEQQGWLEKHAVSEEDRLAAQQAKIRPIQSEDSIETLGKLDVAGPAQV
ncbi:MAG: hypothetical protein Q9167_001554 [Letrouitia subvulpina]